MRWMDPSTVFEPRLGNWEDHSIERAWKKIKREVEKVRKALTLLILWNWVEPELIPCLHPFRFLCRVKATCYCYTMNYRGGRSLPRLLLLPGLLLKGYRTGPGRPNDGKPILRRSTLSQPYSFFFFLTTNSIFLSFSVSPPRISLSISRASCLSPPSFLA